EAEVVLDPPRGSRLAAEHGALDDQRVEPLGGAVDGSAEAGGPTADDEQVDLLSRLQLEADPERARELAVARPAQLDAARKPRQRQVLGLAPRDQRRRLLAVGGVGPGEGEALAPGEVEQPSRLLGVARAEDLDPDPLALLQQLAPLHEGCEQ